MSTIVETRLAEISRRFEPTDDLSAIGSSMERLSPTPVQPHSAHSRTSSTGDSAFYEYDTNEYSEHQLCHRSEPIETSAQSRLVCSYVTCWVYSWEGNMIAPAALIVITISNRFSFFSYSNSLLEKFAMMEERLRSMEAKLKQESHERSKLAVKISKLEEENEALKANRQNAISQLQTFSEKFFAMKEPLAPKFDPSSPVFTSPLNSPRGSHLELRRTGSSSSMHMASRASRHSMKSRSRPTSGISL